MGTEKRGKINPTENCCDRGQGVKVGEHCHPRLLRGGTASAESLIGRRQRWVAEQ